MSTPGTYASRLVVRCMIVSVWPGSPKMTSWSATKLDAPSGTALTTARRLVAKRGSRPFTHKKPEKETIGGTRGGEEGNVAIHSVRLPGFVADQEVIFGLPGQALVITHRTTSREAYVPGVLIAIRAVTSGDRFYRGLDQLLGLR